MRIKVDFSEFFDDERKLSVVNVDPKESTTVRDVLEKIIRLFRLSTSRRRSKREDFADGKPEYGLFEEGFYIPPEETSTVLQEIGILKLKSISDPKVDVSESPEKKKKHKKRKSEDDFVEEPKKTRKSRVDDEDSARSESRKGENVEKRRSKRVKVEDAECSKRPKRHQREESEESDEDSEENDEKVVSSKKTKSPARQKLWDSCQSSDVEVVKVEEVKKERGKRQQSVEPSESGSEVHSEEGDVSKPTKRRALRKCRDHPQKSAAQIQKESPQSLVSCETVATTSSKKHKGDSYTDNMSVTSTNEIESSPPKTRRRHKKDDVTESEAFGTRDKCSVGNTRRNKRLSKSLIEDEMQVEDPEIAEKEEEKVSQEKEVSTSCFVYLESEDIVDNSNDSENFCAESVDSSPAFPCVDEHYKPGPKSRRRRRHAKRKKTSVPSEAKDEASVSNATPRSSACNSSATNVNYRNNVSSSSMNKHVIFGSDDEEEVTSYNNSCDGNDIEIVGQVTRPSGIGFQNPLGFQNQGVIDVEGEDVFRGLVGTSDLDISAGDIRSMYCQSIGPSLEALSHLRRMCEQKTLTVVQVTSKTESVTTQTFTLPDIPTQTDCRGPPSPVHQSFEVGENTKKTFHNLLSLQDRMEPLILKPSGETNMFLNEEDEEEVDLQSKVPDATESSCPSSLPQTSPQKSSGRETDGFGNSGLSDIDKEGSPVDDRPGPSTRSSKKGAPRPYHALGRLLTSLRNTGSSRSREEKLPSVSCLEEASLDSDITSTLTDLESSRVVTPNKLNEEGDDDKAEDRDKSDPKSALCDETGEPDILSNLTEELKGDLLKEIEDIASNKDATYSNFPRMNCLPRVGEFLAIKTLTLDANLRPVYSDYMKVQVLEVSGLVVKMKTVQIAKKKDSVSKVTDEDGVEEVDLTFDEEVDLTEEDPAQILELDWRDIVEPRLLFP